MTTLGGICLSTNARFPVFHYLLLHNTTFPLLLLFLLLSFLWFLSPSLCSALLLSLYSSQLPFFVPLSSSVMLFFSLLSKMPSYRSSQKSTSYYFRKSPIFIMHVEYPLYHGCGGYRRILESPIKIKEWLWEYQDVVVHPDSLCMTRPFFNRVSLLHVWLSFHFYGSPCPLLNQNSSIHVCLLKIFSKNKS